MIMLLLQLDGPSKLQPAAMLSSASSKKYVALLIIVWMLSLLLSTWRCQRGRAAVQWHVMWCSGTAKCSTTAVLIGEVQLFQVHFLNALVA
jgi:hypothetical protein